MDYISQPPLQTDIAKRDISRSYWRENFLRPLLLLFFIFTTVKKGDVIASMPAAISHHEETLKTEPVLRMAEQKGRSWVLGGQAAQKPRLNSLPLPSFTQET